MSHRSRNNHDKFDRKFDRNGVLYLMGTNFATGPYQNPQKLGVAVVTVSSKSPGAYAGDHSFVQNEEPKETFADLGRNNGTNSMRDGQWMAVRLVGLAVDVSFYCLRHGYTMDAYRLRNWDLQGSNDGSKWTTLRSHKGQFSELPQSGFSTMGWEVKGDHGAFSHFRILMTGPNSGMPSLSKSSRGDPEGQDALFCAGIEFYGVLHSESVPAAASPDYC